MARTFTLESPLKEQLLFARLTGTESLGALYEYHLTAFSPRADIAPGELLGKQLVVTMALGGTDKRHFSGYATTMRRSVSGHQGFTVYELTLRPWLWFLTRTSDCRIFQDSSVPKIVSQVFDDEAAQSVDDSRLSATYRDWTYCVQYRETDFNFVSRLFEQEGIYYYFEHTAHGHEMILCDGPGAHKPVGGLSTFDYVPTIDPRIDRDAVVSVVDTLQVEPGAYTLDDYDFKQPGQALAATRKPALPLSHAKADYELFDYPGEFDVAAEGEDYAAVRIEESQSRAETFSFVGRQRHAAVGRRFKLKGHPRREFDQEYLITETTFHAEESNYGSASDPGTQWSLSFSAIRHRQTFRPSRTTPKPVIQGVQTAVVTGPGNEEIHTDKYGRITVQFHWDRYGKKDAKSSCWIRVGTPMAGKGWGMVAVPRIGHEVIVSFEEGDPDRPLVIGSVYNGDNPPPWALPAHATQSGVLTRSSKGGSPGNANAIRFEDKKGAEQLWIHAEKNQDIEVENDEVHSVGHDRIKHVGHDETTNIGHDRTEMVGNDKTIGIGRNKSVNVAVNHSETIGAAMSIVIGGTLTESVAVNYAETVGGAMELTVGAVLVTTVGGALAETVGGARTASVGGSSTESVGANKTVNVGGAMTESVGKDSSLTIAGASSVTVAKQMRTEVAKEYSVQAKKIQLVADDEIILKCGDAEIVMKKNGDITIKGKAINVKGSGDVVLKGSKILSN
jgi:type VI secretion system secreted protein VgrG